MGQDGALDVKSLNRLVDFHIGQGAAAIAGDRETAKAIDARLAALHRALFIEANPIPVKWALCEMGLIRGVSDCP